MNKMVKSLEKVEILISHFSFFLGAHGFFCVPMQRRRKKIKQEQRDFIAFGLLVGIKTFTITRVTTVCKCWKVVGNVSLLSMSFQYALRSRYARR